MTVAEVFRDLSAHLIKGMMIHDQMADYYDFLQLRGYKRCHEYHFKKESAMYRKLHRYYINNYSRLIEEKQIDNPALISPTWYKYKTTEIDAATKQNAVKMGLEMWLSWEAETKAKLEEMSSALYDLSETGAAMFINDMILDVEKEVKCAKRKYIELNSVNYDMPYIYAQQKRLHDKYKRML